MKTDTIHFPGFSILAGAEWKDITAQAGGNDKPFTIARPANGVGAMQFSPALYARGRRPHICLDDLVELLDDFSSCEQLGSGFEQKKVRETEYLAVAVSFHTNDELLRVWYVSDRTNIILVTYVCQWVDRDVEAEDIESMIRSIRFDGK